MYRFFCVLIGTLILLRVVAFAGLSENIFCSYLLKLTKEEIKFINWLDSIQGLVSSDQGIFFRNITDRKREFLAQQGIYGKTQKAVIRISYLREPNVDLIQDEFLKKIHGFTTEQIQTLRQAGMLEVDDLEYQYLTTLPPMNKANIRPRTIVSRPNEEGNLENVKILQIEEDKIHVVSLKKDFLETLSLEDIYAPILPSKEVLYRSSGDLPLRGVIHFIGQKRNIFSGHEESFVIEVKTEYGVISVDYNQLALKPRGFANTGRSDLSKPISFWKLLFFESGVQRLFWIHQIYGENEDFILQNNFLINQLQKEMLQQGISTSTIPSESSQKKEKKYDQALNENVSSSLIVNGVHENGNKTVRQYMRKGELMGSQKLTISFLDNFQLGVSVGGFNKRDSSRTELGYTALEILTKRTCEMANHEFRHQMFNSRRHAYRRSLFDHDLSLAETASLNLLGEEILKKEEQKTKNPYSRSMSLEEIYNYAHDVLAISKGLKRFSRKEAFFIQIIKQTYERRRVVFKTLRRRFDILGRLARNVKEITKNILQKLNEKGLNHPLGQDIKYLSLEDPYGRIINFDLPKELLQSSSQNRVENELRKILEDILEMTQGIIERKKQIVLTIDSSSYFHQQEIDRKIISQLKQLTAFLQEYLY